MSYLYETHLHTFEASRCAKTPAREFIPYYLDQGYRGIIVTDHFCGNVSYKADRNLPWRDQVDAYCRGYEEALDEGIKRGLDVFFGIEQHFDGDEALIYGVDKQWLYDNPDVAAWNRKELFDHVSAAGGCIVQAHPFRVRGYISCVRLNSFVHGIEAFNGGNNPWDDRYALAYAKDMNLPITAGTDMHTIGGRPEIYNFGVCFDEPWTNISDYVHAILNKKPFGVKYETGRETGDLQPIDIPCEFWAKDGQVRSFDPETLK